MTEGTKFALIRKINSSGFFHLRHEVQVAWMYWNVLSKPYIYLHMWCKTNHIYAHTYTNTNAQTAPHLFFVFHVAEASTRSVGIARNAQLVNGTEWFEEFADFLTIKTKRHAKLRIRKRQVPCVNLWAVNEKKKKHSYNISIFTLHFKPYNAPKVHIPLIEGTQNM